MAEWNSETAEWYASKYGEYATNRLAVAELDLRSDSVVVDVGCGTGAALRAASSQVAEGVLIGIDPVPRMIEIARESSTPQPAAERIDYRVGAAEDLPVDDAAADFVFAFDSLDHWQSVERGLSEVRRILRPGGQFVLVKDGGVPGAGAAGRTFADALQGAGFVISSQQKISEEGVSFALWLCVVSP